MSGRGSSALRADRALLIFRADARDLLYLIRGAAPAALDPLDGFLEYFGFFNGAVAGQREMPELTGTSASHDVEPGQISTAVAAVPDVLVQDFSLECPREYMPGRFRSSSALQQDKMTDSMHFSLRSFGINWVRGSEAEHLGVFPLFPAFRSRQFGGGNELF